MIGSIATPSGGTQVFTALTAGTPFTIPLGFTVLAAVLEGSGGAACDTFTDGGAGQPAQIKFGSTVLVQAKGGGGGRNPTDHSGAAAGDGLPGDGNVDISYIVGSPPLPDALITTGGSHATVGTGSGVFDGGLGGKVEISNLLNATVTPGSVITIVIGNGGTLGPTRNVTWGGLGSITLTWS